MGGGGRYESLLNLVSMSNKSTLYNLHLDSQHIKLWQNVKKKSSSEETLNIKNYSLLSHIFVDIWRFW